MMQKTYVINRNNELHMIYNKQVLTSTKYQFVPGPRNIQPEQPLSVCVYI